MKVVVADDEPLARRRLQALLEEQAGVQVVASAADGEAALAACEAWQPALLILDIRMPGMDGLQAARRLAGMAQPPQVVFCTAYEQHALEAWGLHASDYLLKPVSRERLAQALQRVRELHAASRSEAWLHARRHGQDFRIRLDEVLYFIAGDKYVTAHLANDSVLLDDSLKALLEAWPEQLLRVHRNCVVPRQRLRAIHEQAGHVSTASILGSEVRLEISRRNLPALRKLLRGRQSGG